MMDISQTGKVPFAEKMILGLGMLASFFGYVAVNSLAYPVYGMILGVSPALIGIALLIPRIWDAFTDPVMGLISDNFHSKWGRRKPFIVFGSVFMGVVFGLLWMAPAEWSEMAKMVYFIILQILFFTFFTIFYVPYTALTYEMTPDYDERTRVMSVTAFFHKTGEFVYQWTIPVAAFISVTFFADSLLEGQDLSLGGIRLTCWAIGLVGLTFFGVLPGLFVRERFQKKIEKQEKVKFWLSFRQALSSLPFLPL